MRVHDRAFLDFRMIEKPNPAEDAALIKSVLDGRPEAIKDFVRRFGPLLKSVAASKLFKVGRSDETEDVVQEIFAELFQKDSTPFRRWDPSAGRSLRAYLAWFASQRTKNYLRRPLARPTSDEALARAIDDTPSDPVELTDSVLDANDALRRFLEAASFEDLQFLNLALIDQKSTDEISKATGLKPANIYQRKKRLIERLRSLLRP